METKYWDFLEKYRLFVEFQFQTKITSSIYLERRNEARLSLKEGNRFCGFIEYVFADSKEECMEIALQSEIQKISNFEGHSVRRNTEKNFEFETRFNCENLYYKHHHFISEDLKENFFHLTLLSGFSPEDIELLRNFGQIFTPPKLHDSNEAGEALDINFEGYHFTESAGEVLYLN
jgi:hypothetical protein